MGPRAAELVGSGLPTAQDGRDSSWRPLPTAGAAIPQPGLTCRWHCCTSARAAGTSSAPNGPKSHGSRRRGPGSLWRPRRSLQTDRRDFFFPVVSNYFRLILRNPIHASASGSR